MQASALHVSPPVLGAYLIEGTSFGDTSTLKVISQRIRSWCVKPVLSANTEEEVYEQVQRRLPVFAVLRVRLIEAAFALMSPEQVITQTSSAYQEMGEKVRGWSAALDETTRTELEVALAAVDHATQAIVNGLSKEPLNNEDKFPDLLLAAALAEYLLICLVELADGDPDLPSAPHVVHLMRYANLDYMSAVEAFFKPSVTS